LAVKPLSASAASRRLLSYLVEQSLAGRGAQMKQTTIAQEVLGLGRDFDPDKTPIVRMQVGRMRRALAKHYAGLGALDDVIFTIPSGSYEIRFERAAPAARRKPPRALPRPIVGVVEFRGVGLRDPWTMLPYVLAEDLSIALGRMPDLRVLGPFARARLDHEGLEVPDLAKRHRADFFIDGSLQRQGRAHTLRVRLLEGRTGCQIWGGTYACGAGRSCDLAGMESDLMKRLAFEIGSEYGVLHQHLSALAQVKPDRALTVYEAVVTARAYFQHPTIGALRRALKALRSALAKHPDESVLHAMLALVLSCIPTEPLWRGPMPLREMAAHADRSYALDPDNGWSLLALGVSAVLHGQSAELSRLSERLMADRLAPRNLLGGMGLWMCHRKVNVAEGLRLIEEAGVSNPHVPGVLRLGPCIVALEAGDWKKAAREIDAYGFPDGWMDSLVRATIAALRGRAEEAQSNWRRFLRFEPDFPRHGFRRVRLLMHDDYVGFCVRALRGAGVRIPESKWPSARNGGRDTARRGTSS
jgi:TolB-like protein